MKKQTELEATPENIRRLQAALQNADALAQEAENTIHALAESIKLLLQQPDSGGRRVLIASLADQIMHRSSESSDAINVDAEELHCNYIDEKGRALSDRIYASTRDQTAH